MFKSHCKIATMVFNQGTRISRWNISKVNVWEVEWISIVCYRVSRCLIRCTFREPSIVRM